MANMTIQVGLDPGKRQDPAGLVVAEVAGSDYIVRLIERSHKEYTKLRDRLVEIDQRLRTRGICVYYVESNGCGEPFIDMLRETVLRQRLWSVYTTSSDKVRRDEEKREMTIGKSLLVTRLTVLLEQGRLHLPDNEQGEELTDELEDFGYEMASGNVKYEAETGHDDLVIALALATYAEPKAVSRVVPHAFVGASRAKPSSVLGLSSRMEDTRTSARYHEPDINAIWQSIQS
jgi:hypothetical protein